PIVIMMLAPVDRQAQLAACRELGIRSYVTKPTKSSDLLLALMKSSGLIGDAQADLTPVVDLQGSDPAHEPVARMLEVLLVDDNLFNQKVGVLKLQKQGCQAEV